MHLIFYRHTHSSSSRHFHLSIHRHIHHLPAFSPIFSRHFYLNRHVTRTSSQYLFPPYSPQSPRHSYSYVRYILLSQYLFPPFYPQSPRTYIRHAIFFSRHYFRHVRGVSFFPPFSPLRSTHHAVTASFEIAGGFEASLPVKPKIRSFESTVQ